MEILNGWQENYCFTHGSSNYLRKRRLKVIWQINGASGNLTGRSSIQILEPKGRPGLVLKGTPEKAGIFEVSVTAQNQWGSVTDTFNLEVQAKPPKSQTADATQVGSSSARLQANVFDLGGMDSNLSFFWGTDPGLSGAAETSF